MPRVGPVQHVRNLRGVAHGIFAALCGQVVDPLFGIINQTARKILGHLRIGRGHLHSDQSFGRIIADFHRFLEGFIGFLIRWIVAEPLDRVDPILGEMRLKPYIVVEPDHRLFGLQERLHANTVLCIGKLRRQKAPQRTGAARAFVLDDQEFGFCRVHRRRDFVEIISGQECRQNHEKREPDEQQTHFFAAAARDVALNVLDFLRPAIRRAQFC